MIANYFERGVARNCGFWVLDARGNLGRRDAASTALYFDNG